MANMVLTELQRIEGLENPNIRHFKDLDDVLANLDTLTFEECN